MTSCHTCIKSWWRHQMETFSVLLAICAGNSLVNFPHKGQRRGALMFSLICVWINGWVNNREAGDLRRYRAHYDVIVMVHVIFFLYLTDDNGLGFLRSSNQFLLNNISVSKTSLLEFSQDELRVAFLILCLFVEINLHLSGTDVTMLPGDRISSSHLQGHTWEVFK